MSKSLRNSYRISQRNPRDLGMSLIELIIAMAVLSIGMLGAMTLMVVGMSNNANSKTDTAATILDQQILEEFATLKNYPKNSTVTITDCALTGSNTHLASLFQAASPGNGATLYTSATAPMPSLIGAVNWSVAAPTLATSGASGYAMHYKTCNGDMYEVRWNVTELNNRLSLLTVSSQQLSGVNVGSNGAKNALLHARPTSLKTLIEIESSL
jgi:prepilin-type N-terminal cleavage/methylation domain-containing protein